MKNDTHQIWKAPKNIQNFNELKPGMIVLVDGYVVRSCVVKQIESPDVVVIETNGISNPKKTFRAIKSKVFPLYERPLGYALGDIVELKGETIPKIIVRITVNGFTLSSGEDVVSSLTNNAHTVWTRDLHASAISVTNAEPSNIKNPLLYKKQSNPGFSSATAGGFRSDGKVSKKKNKKNKKKPIDIKTVIEYACGAMVYNGNVYLSVDETRKAHPKTRFYQEPQKVDITLEYHNIATHFSIDALDIVPVDIGIDKEVKISLDHPINIEKKRWVILVGESGTGKTESAIKYATDKGQKYILQQGNAQVTVDDLKGYRSITTGEYFGSLLREAVEHGWLYIFDEIDACNPNTLLVLNSLKRDQFQFEDELVDIHPDFRMIATANTLEYSEVYNARTPLDKATISRFKVIQYDLKPYELAVRYGLEYIKDIKDIEQLTPREVEGLVLDQKVKESDYEF